MKQYSFISDKILSGNLDITSEHILELMSISESLAYQNEKILLSSFRKTIIIHTASIIEALLLWKLKKEIKHNTVILSNEWKYTEIKKLHKISDDEYIVGANKKREIKRLDKLDFFRIIDVCSKHKIINNSLKNKLNKVRTLRNRLHVGGLVEIEKEYKKSDLEFVFSVAKEIKILCQNT